MGANREQELSDGERPLRTGVEPVCEEAEHLDFQASRTGEQGLAYPGPSVSSIAAGDVCASINERVASRFLPHALRGQHPTGTCRLRSWSCRNLVSRRSGIPSTCC
jgi:hypothetical protein